MIKLLYIDLFCGAGGTSTGVELATLHGEKCAKVIACVNHDTHAIASHLANHPETKHFTEDIRTLEMSPLVEITEKAREQYPGAKVVLWASLECTNFSKAKGGQPRDADSRTLADHLFRYIEALDPDYIQIENVEEFMSWGALDDNGKPISKEAGRDYVRWCEAVKRYGYQYHYRLLNSADFGAYTSRKRFFGQFVRDGLAGAFPMPTHDKKGGGLFGALPWKPVREVLDFSDEGESIFGRKKPLVEATLRRIYAGLVKFVGGGRESHLLVKYNSVNEPAGTITTKDHHAIITYYGNGSMMSVEHPAPTVTTHDRVAKVQVSFLANEYSGGGQLGSIDDVCPAILTTPKQKLASCFLMNPQYNSAGGSVDNPCFTLIARMDKMPPYLVQTTEGVGIEVYEDDSPMTRTIKEFMAAYGIIDIKMRMLKVSELLAIMGFPRGYKLVGTQSEQKKFIGNAVEVTTSRRLCEALAERITI